MKKLASKVAVYLRVLPRARRKRLDLLERMVRRPQLLAGIGAYEVGLFTSNRAEERLKLLAQLRVSSLIGCRSDSECALPAHRSASGVAAVVNRRS